jgi:hypothetical protein
MGQALLRVGQDCEPFGSHNYLKKVRANIFQSSHGGIKDKQIGVLEFIKKTTAYPASSGD